MDGGCGPSQTFDVERGGYLVGAAVDVDAIRAPLDPGAGANQTRSWRGRWRRSIRLWSRSAARF